MCFGCTKEPSHRDGSFEYPQHMFWFRNKKTGFQLLLSRGLYGKISNTLLKPQDKSAYWKTIFFITHPKHMLLVLKRTVSMRQFFGAPKTHV